MSTDGTEVEPRRRKVKRRSFADECRQHERDNAVKQAKLATLMTVVDQIEPAPGSERLKTLAASLIREMIE